MTDRMDRIEEMIKRDISVILDEEINDPRVRHVTITRVELSRDLRSARVFCTISTEESEKPEIMKGLTSAGRFIRASLAKRISLKFTPRISFREDRGEEKSSVDRIFEEIEKEHRKEGN